MSEFSSSKLSSSESMSAKISSSSTKMSSSASSKISSSSMGTEIDELLAASGAARDAARGIAATSLASRMGSELDDIDSLMGSTNISSGTNISSSSSKKVSSSSRMSSISQSSMEMSDGGDGPHVTSSVVAHSKSSATSAKLQTKEELVDGKLVSAETLAEKSAKKAESGMERVTEDGKTLVDTGFNVAQSYEGKLKSTAAMSGEEIDKFFRQEAIKGKATESLDFNKDDKSFQASLVDLPQFSPQELTVKIVDGVITVLGSHEEKVDENNFRTHQYVRRFTMPEGLSTDTVIWELEPSGVLQIKAGDKFKGITSQVHLNCTIFKPRSFFKNK